jgi:FeS assembly SUF system protein
MICSREELQKPMDDPVMGPVMGQELSQDTAVADAKVAETAVAAADEVGAEYARLTQPPRECAIPAEEIEQLTADIVAALKTVYDPEIPCDIYELGLIYRIDIDDNRHVTIEMTLTAPGCPVAGEMPQWVENAVNGVAGVSGTVVKLTFDPPWTNDRMSDEARLALNMF